MQPSSIFSAPPSLRSLASQVRLHRAGLPNGLRVLVLTLPHVHSVEVGLFVKAGPRYESQRDGGISHFTEHMLFKGTRSLPSTFALHAEVERLGSPISALTARDHCQYYFTLPPRHLARGLELFSHIMQQPTFAGIDTEREIILEELLGELNEEGDDSGLENRVRRLLWPESSLGQSILGCRDNILRFSARDLAAHHARHYTGHNAILYFAGAIPPDDALALAARSFGTLAEGAPLEVPPLQEMRSLRTAFLDHDDTQKHLFLSFLSPAYTHPDYMAMVALQNLLTEGISSRLQWHLCEHLGMVYDLDAGLESFHDTAAFDIEASAASNKLLPLMREVLTVLDGLRQTPPGSDELERAQERYEIGFEFSLDNPGALASWLVSQELHGPPISLLDHLEAMRSLTPTQLHAVARRIFQPDRLAVVVGGNPGRTERRQIMRLLDDFART